MAYLYKRNIDKPIGLSTLPTPVPATITTVDLPIPAIGTDSKLEIPDLSEPSLPSHITFMSYDDYLRDIASMCKNDRMFMERMKTFWNDIVEDEKDGMDKPLQSTKPSCQSGDGSR